MVGICVGAAAAVAAAAAVFGVLSVRRRRMTAAVAAAAGPPKARPPGDDKDLRLAGFQSLAHEDIEICKNPENGSDWLLGAGAYGKVSIDGARVCG